MPEFGSHLSIAGGYHKAVRRAAELGFTSVQIFTKNNNQWRGKPLSEADVASFRQALSETDLAHTVAHNSYLINLATADPELLQKSREAMAVELERAHALGIAHVVAHPGAHVGAGEEAGLARIADSLDAVFARTAHLPTKVALETTAGQGTCLGHRFEHLGAIIERCSFPERISLCVDTCHIFAAGYRLAPRRAYLRTMRELDAAVGLERIAAFHLNDSKRALGSRVDRHEHIGKGFIGEEAFVHIVNDKRFRRTPMLLETAKDEDPETGRPWDLVNLDRLRSFLRK